MDFGFLLIGDLENVQPVVLTLQSEAALVEWRFFHSRLALSYITDTYIAYGSPQCPWV
jgi:hypothetical protein